MDETTAIRFAATAVEGVSRAEAQAIVTEYRGWLAKCHVCNGTHVLKFRHDTDHRAGRDGLIRAGSEITCPRCGRDGPGDPDYVAWHCFHGEKASFCQSTRESPRGSNSEMDRPHADCGYRIMLPLVDQS